MAFRGTALLLAIGAAGPAGAMTMSSADLANGAPFAPAQIHDGCGGRDVSPQLAWRGTPPAARSLALTMIDQDVAPAEWSHWIVVDLPAASAGLPQGAESLPRPARTVVSNMGRGPYAGPCPPHGSGVHHYQITIWALPTATIAIAPGAKADAVETQLRAVALDHATMVGTAER
jgi:hypothetical protein